MYFFRFLIYHVEKAALEVNKVASSNGEVYSKHECDWIKGLSVVHYPFLPLKMSK